MNAVSDTYPIRPSVRPSHCGIKSKLITVGSCGFNRRVAPTMSACVNPTVCLSRMSRKYTIYLNMSLLGGICVEIIWHFDGDRAEKRTVAAGTGWGRGQWWRERGGNGYNGGGNGVGMGIKLWEWGGDGDKIFYRVSL